MHVFYTPDLQSNAYTLNEQESKHCVQVLRLKEGDYVVLVDGKGGYFTASIVSADRRRVALEITSAHSAYGKVDYHLHIAVAPTKNIERIEWFAEKATELGIAEITPLICARSERKVVKTERLNKVVTAAVKQSMQAYHPLVNDPVDFKSFIKDKSGIKLIAHCEDADKQSISECLSAGEDCLVLIGPEGDFTSEEIKAALKSGFKPITLGTNRLRTETAALAACFEINYINR